MVWAVNADGEMVANYAPEPALHRRGELGSQSTSAPNPCAASPPVRQARRRGEVESARSTAAGLSHPSATDRRSSDTLRRVAVDERRPPPRRVSQRHRRMAPAGQRLAPRQQQGSRPTTSARSKDARKRRRPDARDTLFGWLGRLASQAGWSSGTSSSCGRWGRCSSSGSIARADR